MSGPTGATRKAKEHTEGLSDPDLTEFYAAKRPQGPPCTVATILAKLSPQRVAQLEAAMERSPNDIEHTIVARVVNGWIAPDQVSPQTIARHRRRECSCPKST